MTESNDELPLSVVVIGRNEGDRLIRCIESVKSMNWPKGGSEIIYVDSNSTDGSSARVEAMGVKVIVVHAKFPTAALARNVGWRAATSPFILFLDGDTILHPNFVKKTRPLLDDPMIAIVWGHVREIHPGASIYNRVLDLDWVYPTGPSQSCGGNALIRRSVLEEIGGYDNGLIAGEEPEMCCRIRAREYSILHVDHPMVGHDLDMMRFSQYWRRAVRSGYAYAEVARRFYGTNESFWAHEVRRSRNHGIFFICLFALSLSISIGYATLWPLLIALLALSGLAIRTALKVRWKSPCFMTRLLYGFHSHFQHIPIFLGQMRYHLDRISKHQSKLIEYKAIR